MCPPSKDIKKSKLLPEKRLCCGIYICYNNRVISKVFYGVLAQLVERYTGSVEVSGSNPLCSTRKGTAFCGAFFRWSIMVVRKAAVRARSFSSAALPRGPFGVSAETAMPLRCLFSVEHNGSKKGCGSREELQLRCSAEGPLRGIGRNRYAFAVPFFGVLFFLIV